VLSKDPVAELLNVPELLMEWVTLLVSASEIVDVLVL
jgi:hypothetical protein